MLSIRIFASGIAGEDGARGRQPVRARHGHVHHHHARLQLVGQANGFLAGARLAHDRDRRIVLEQAAEAAPHQRVIVDEQDGDRLSHAECQTPSSAPEAYQRAAVARPQELERAADQLGALAHRHQAQPARRGAGVEALAVILDLELQGAGARSAASPRRARVPACRATLLIASCSTR